MRKLLLTLALLVLSVAASAEDLTRITVHVTNERGKPVDRAAVVVQFVKGRNLINMKKIRKTWEMRTSQEGMAKVPGLPKGDIRIQVIAQNYQTFGDTFSVDEDERTIEVVLKPPQPQYSAH
jgi:archaellin